MKSANSQPLVKPDAVEYGININPFHRNPRLSIVRQMPKPPPISERDSWQTLIEDGRILGTLFRFASNPFHNSA